ncbi:MAG: DUF935 family protein, partial [Cohaesibacteraceae bacterium]|nr:DUF935 family protein [Cohaesibacteraceae bacterium]
VFKEFAEYLDGMISKAVLGQTMTTDDGSSQAQAEVHDRVRMDILQADAKQLSATINMHLIRPYVDMNFGVQEAYPTFKIEPQIPEDLDLLSRVIERLAKLGLKISQKEIRDKFGLSEPDKGEEVIGALVDIVSSSDDKKSANSIALNRQRSDQTNNFLDDITEIGLDDWREQGDAMLEPVHAALNKATSLEEFGESLAGLMSEQDMGPLTDAIANATLAARGLGEAGNG